MMTNDERREAVARLRQIADEYAAKAPVVFANPTCYMTCMGSFTASHDFTRWECGKCGAYAFAPKKVFDPRFCPNCGARVVTDDDVNGD